MKMLEIFSLIGAFVLFFPFVPAAQANDEAKNGEDSENFPALAIEFRSDQSEAQIALLKIAYDTCKANQKVTLSAYKQGGATWEHRRRSLPPKYLVDALSEEPGWEEEKVGVFSSREYFDGDKYAKYTYRKNYSISEEGRCSLVQEPTAHIELDDTETRYNVKYKGKRNLAVTPGNEAVEWLTYKEHRVSSNQSPVPLRKQHVAKLKELSRNPAFRKMAKTMLGGSTGAACLPGKCDHANMDLQGISELKKLAITNEQRYSDSTLVRSHEGSKPLIIANQPVDMVESAGLGGTVWYWHHAREYPGIMGRSIVLRTETKALLGGHVVTEAVSFKKSAQLPDSIFQPEQGLLQHVTNHSDPDGPAEVPQYTK